tara:strand:- start:738 stop:2534 length:1797 start_codon:yes stop_codon:yes gene_type:complete
LSFWLRLGIETNTRILDSLWLFPSTITSGILIYFFTGQYRGLTRHLKSKALYQIVGRNFLIILVISLISVMGELTMPPRSSLLLLWILLSVFVGGLRFIIRDALLKNRQIYSENKPKENVVIYGAGTAGARLASSLKNEDSTNILFFVDDSPFLNGRTLDGIPIKSPDEIFKYKSKIKKILIAISSINRTKRNQIKSNLEFLKIPIFTIPSIVDIISKKFTIKSNKSLFIEDLLGREKVLPDPLLLSEGMKNESILITGAGGSIGSELCKQIIKLKPSRIILLELSEIALYKIEKELKSLIDNSTIIKGYLGDACNKNLLRFIFKKNEINIVFHAAAYKHVPIVELNPLIGIKNNVFSTQAICEVSDELKISKFVLISTDKAVRPTNIMGASKRLAELIVQVYSEKNKKDSSTKSSHTKFSMVRFGNVLNSSGSVVPQFKEQISNGGPITITHPDIIRYFMTIEEAAQLVIQAAKLSLGGDLFVLDMGSPVKITELAEQMVTLSGLKLKDESNKDGDIEIVFTGLRPGEKLYEELLIDAECLKTSHPLIFRALEKSIKSERLWKKLNALQIAIDKHNHEESIKILSELVPQWKKNNSP